MRHSTDEGQRPTALDAAEGEMNKAAGHPSNGDGNGDSD